MDETAPKPKFFQRHPALKDGLSLIGFIIAVWLGTLFLNTFVIRSYNVVGSSMENTLHDDDKIFVNRLPVTWAHLWNKEWMPERGQIIVFSNPNYKMENQDQYIIKRVIAFAGERVIVKDGKITIYNDENPDGFNPDDGFNGEPKDYTSGDTEVIVGEGEVFVSGDNRDGNHSYDSRNGLGTVPLYDIVGPAGVRIWPFNKFRFF